jgi:hypothetical protein
MWDLWWTKWRWGRFLRLLRFPLPIFIPPISPQSPSPIIWGWYNRPVVAAVLKVPPGKLRKKLTTLPRAQRETIIKNLNVKVEVLYEKKLHNF